MGRHATGQSCSQRKPAKTNQAKCQPQQSLQKSRQHRDQKPLASPIILAPILAVARQSASLKCTIAVTMDDAITLLKNEAFRLNSNLLVPMQMNSERTDDYNMISIEARMLTCPLKLARGN
jgi:hypothetical protein